MKNITGLRMSWNEYKEIVDEVTDRKVILAVTDGEWDYLCSTDFNCDVEEIHDMIGNYLGVRIADVIIDISKEAEYDGVIIVTE